MPGSTQPGRLDDCSFGFPVSPQEFPFRRKQFPIKAEKFPIRPPREFARKPMIFNAVFDDFGVGIG
jgi:hypothetical protein